MRTTIYLATLLGGLLALSSCNGTACGTGTIERNGTCEPADVTTGVATCGPFTELEGDQCVPMFPPTMCDPTTTTPDVDTTTGVTTCIGNGTSGGCTGTFACPLGTSGTVQTICGQIYDLADNTPFAATGATGTKCDSANPTATGPCALAVTAYDAIMYGMDPSSAPALDVASTYIDDCGRYRMVDISVPSGPFIGLGFDDAVGAMGPAGVTNTTGVATPKDPGNQSPGNPSASLDAWIVTSATTDMWTTTGGPPLSGGIYVGIFRQHICPAGVCTGDPLAVQAGVTFTKSGVTEPADDYYFLAAETTHLDIDPSTIATGANGTGLLTNASVNDSLVYSGVGGITDTTDCKWETHAAASLPNIVFMQVYRPQNQIGKTCTQ